ncbi:MAG TPA: ABC transporter permease [Thermoleophilaceae bacterium]
MIGLTLGGLVERKLRSALTAIAVLLGVAMIAGTYVLTDQIRGGFEDLESSIYQDVDVELIPRDSFTSQFSTPRPLSDRMIERIRAVPGVAKVSGELWSPAGLVIDGELKKASGGGGTIVTSSSEEPFNPATEVDGRLPHGPREVALLRATAEKYDLGPGDQIGIATHRGVVPVTVVGSYEIGDANPGGTDVISAGLDDLQTWFDREGEVTSVNVDGADDITPAELARRVRQVVPHRVEVRTGQAAARETASDINEQIGGFLKPALLAFAGAALLVGAFIIFNTFTITVAERTREFAMLRTLGATRRQILGAVSFEALVIGLTASLAGLALGLLFAKGTAKLFEAAGLGIPTSGLQLAPRTIAISLLVGVGVTQLAALVPARRATRVSPIAALQRSDQETPTRHARWRPWIAATVVLLGVGLLVAGLFASGPAASRLATMALGVVVLFVGVGLSARWFVRPLAGAIGWPLERLFAEPGLLARENAMRNPGRTATTAAALMVGLGLVVFVAVFANGIKASFDATVTRVIRADLIIRSDTMQPIPAAAADAVAETPEVASTSAVQLDQIQVNGKKSSIITDVMNGVDPISIGNLYEIDWLKGGPRVLDDLSGTGALVEEQFSKTHGVGVGDSFRIETPTGGRARLHAIGVYRDPQMLQGTIVSKAFFDEVSSARDPWLVFAHTLAGLPPDEAKAAVEDAVEPFPVASVKTRSEWADAETASLDQFIYLLYALLGMSVVISMFGIANSLFLSIHERTREFGLLRAVGATRAQVRRMVRYESVITAVIGGLLGIGVGLLFAFLVTQSLGDLGLGFEPPPGQLAVFLVLAVVVGVIAAALPARRSARLQVLEALRAE